MEKIGAKIKRIRKEIGLSQENIHPQQSLISQIESGRIANPTEGVLQKISEKLDTTFLALVEGTDWKKKTMPIISNDIAFSPVIVDFDVDDMGNISWLHKSYQLYNEKGEKNKYCPESGKKLIEKCKKCGRQVNNVRQKFCFGCGETLFVSYNLPFIIKEINSNRRVFEDFTACNDTIGTLGENANMYRDLLVIFEMVSKSEDVDSILNKFYQISRSLGLSESIKHQILNAINENREISGEIVNQINFYIQAIEAMQKKLRSVIIALTPPEDINTVDDLKTELFRAATGKIIEKFDDSTNAPSLETLIEMLKDLETTQDKKDLITKLEKKIDPEVKTEGESNYKRKRLWEI